MFVLVIYRFLFVRAFLVLWFFWLDIESEDKATASHKSMTVFLRKLS